MATERASLVVRLRRLPRKLVRFPLNIAKGLAAHLIHQATLLRLRAERWRSNRSGGSNMHRVIATACWKFPIYSQTFVYQEVTQLIKRSFDLRFIYSKREPRELLPSQFASLWRMKRRWLQNAHTYQHDFRYYNKRMPAKVEALTQMVSEASGLSQAKLIQHADFLKAFSFTRMVQAYDPAYLHSYFFYEGSFFAMVASFMLDIPRGVSCYADHLLQDYDLKVVPLHLQLCDVVVATSHKIKQELQSIAPGVDADRILVKPNAISTTQFPSTVREEPVDGQPLRLVCVGRVDPKKGLIYLVDAIGAMRDRDFNVECHFVGTRDRDRQASVDYGRKLESRIAELGLQDSVHLEGRKSQSDLNRLLRRSHVFVAPYVELPNGDKDGIPTTLLEAMATGLPVVATDAGSIPEVIADGWDGVLVPQRDPEALARAIIALFNDPERRTQLGERARRKIHAQFDVEVCEPQFHDRVLSVLRRHQNTNGIPIAGSGG